MGFAENLRHLRRKFDVPQVLLAEEIGVPAALVRRWEERGLVPDAACVERIASYFRIPSDWLLKENDLRETAPLKNNPLDWKPHPSQRKIACLRCERKFASTGAHNRICDRCKKGSHQTTGVEERYRLHSMRIG